MQLRSESAAEQQSHVVPRYQSMSHTRPGQRPELNDMNDSEFSKHKSAGNGNIVRGNTDPAIGNAFPEQ